MEKHLINHSYTFMIEDGEDRYVLQDVFNEAENGRITTVLDTNAKDITETEKGKDIIERFCEEK